MRTVIILAEHDAVQRNRLQAFLLRQGFKVIALADVHGILHALRHQRHFDLLLINASLEAAHDGMEIVYLLHQRQHVVPIILLATNSSEELAITALRAGVKDYFAPPFSCEDVL